ncbi:MAG: DUF1127 domain-containing protein [Rhodobacteraceae bacterium]|nr:DUF1127 domain-containing protein [Paracoccaceae bacterium]
MAHITTTPRFVTPWFSTAGLVQRILLGLGAAEQRRRLAQLDDTQLRDIGVTREDARTEANRPVWDVPQSWLR